MKRVVMGVIIFIGLMLFPCSAKAATLQETLALWQQAQSQATALQNIVAQFNGIALTDPNQIATLESIKQQATIYQNQADALYQQVQLLYSQQLQSQTKIQSTSVTQTAPTVQTTGMVWLSRTGSKYHSFPNCSGMNSSNAFQVTLQEALDLGKKRCNNCW